VIWVGTAVPVTKTTTTLTYTSPQVSNAVGALAGKAH
jgi:hypothetical protein